MGISVCVMHSRTAIFTIDMGPQPVLRFPWRTNEFSEVRSNQLIHYRILKSNYMAMHLYQEGLMID